MPSLVLSTRMLVGLVALAFALVVAATTAALVTARSGAKAELVEHAEDLVATMDVGRLHERKLASGRGFLLAGDEESLAAYHDADRGLHTALGELRQQIETAEGIALLAAIVDLEVDHDHRMEELIRVGGAAARLRWRGEAMPLARETRQAIDALIAHKRALYEAAGIAATGADERNTLLLIGLVVAALALGVTGALLLRRPSQFLATLLDQLPAGVIVAEAPSGRILHVNRAASRLIGTRPPDPDHLARALAGETVAAQLQLDEGRTIEVSAGPIRDGTGVIAAVVAVTDVTERQRAERERDEFIHVLGHDLRNPLTAISMSATHLAGKSTSETDGRAAARISRAATRMMRLIAQLLDFARGRAGRLVIEPRRTDLRALLAEVIEEVELGYPDCKIELIADGEVDGEWDRDRLSQVFQNLIGNAVDHHVAGSAIEVRVIASADDVVVAVTNQGDSIPAELLPHVFEPFRRGGGAGLGLGLYIVQQLVAAHGGTVEVESLDGHTTFRVRLPRRAPLQAAA